ncbi:Protein FAR1-RELATED SEQUENCE 9 [Linum perenne]
MIAVLDQNGAEGYILDEEYAELRELTNVQVEGLEFKSYEEGRDWYTKYGKTWGFDVKLDDMKYDKDGAILERIIYSRQEAERIAEGDAATALAYLKSKTKQDPNFFMEYTLNEDNMLEKVFWADSMSIADFECFGEILEFDATYNKIKYNLPLVIFSDGDRAMSSAIKIEFPEATHRLCSWHLNNNVTQLVKNYKFRKLREEELRLDYQSIHSTPELQSKALKSLEESAAAVYSLKAFLKFRDELECSTGCIKEGKEIDGGCHTYTVTMFGAEDISWKVTYDDTKNTVHCSCDKFIQMGILCPHMIFVLKEESKSQIPSSFVKHCWRKTPKEYANMPQPTHVHEAQQIRLRHGILTYTAVEFFQRGVLSAESCKVAQEALKTVIKNLRNMDQGPIQTPKVIVPKELKGIKDPKNVAFKGSTGKKAIKQRKCGYYKKLGHYQTNCSQKLAEETEAARAGTGDLGDEREETD